MGISSKEIQTLLALATFFAGMFFASDRKLSKDSQKKVSQLLTGLAKKEASGMSWIQNFLTMFYGIFGDRAWSRKRLIRSFTVSMIMTIIIAFTVNQDMLSDLGFFPFLLSYIILGIYPAAFDVLSLNTSAFILKKATVSTSWTKHFLILILDFSTSAFFAYFIVLFHIGELPDLSDISWFIDPEEPGKVYWPFAISSFLTSIWLYIFVLGVYVLKILLPIYTRFTKSFSLFDLKKHPLTAIGFIGGWVILLFGIIVCLFIEF